MELVSKYDLLRKCSLFQDCDENTLKAIANDTYHKSYEKGVVLLTPESTIHKVSIVVNKGRMKIFTYNPSTFDYYTIYVLSHGDIFNTITFFDGKKDNLSALALDNLEVLHCNIDVAREWIVKHQALNRKLLAYLSERLRMAIEFNMSKTFYTIELRLAKLIFQNISNDDGQLNLINDLPHNEIAQIIGTSRAVVNRNLQKLKSDGLIDIKYKQIVIEDYEKLKALIEDSMNSI